MNRKLGLLSLVLVVLLGVGAYLWLFGRPSAPSVNPLKKVPLDKMSGLVIKNYFGTTRLVKNNNDWSIVEPLKDQVDPTIVTDIISSLQSFTLGSIISENPARYGEFHVDPVQAAQVDVFVEGQDKPVFSGFVGKNNNGYENCYFRFAVSSGPVYMANGLAEYQFRREPNGFRLMSLLTWPKDDPTRVRFVSGKKQWDVSRASETWTTASGSPLATDQAKMLVANLHNLRAEGFGTGQETSAQLGFEPSPAAILTVESGTNSTVLTFGKIAPEKQPSAPPTRYVQSNKRTVVFRVPESSLTTLTDLFAKLSK